MTSRQKLTNLNRAKAILDTTSAVVWSQRASACVGDIDAASQAIQTVAMMLVQLSYDNALINDAIQVDRRIAMIAQCSTDLPKEYLHGYSADLVSIGGCSGPEQVLQTEADFATETVLAALTEHHELHLAGLGLLGQYWYSTTLPKLRNAVREVLETRNAINF